ncbi:MAG: SET domain-containing protein-lysine N-methyltransferase [Chitinophagaceae bacterium]|nr:SET domain-containing protein-lysine N-methyltransferase [Bacteroidota bacterium]MCC6256983.1 SET domain-containing protein-lysine N-methyltransferase [Chitinophagaceae bacterium]MCW5916344.1 SET domain-containing protein-lysine N-methyltransferase [Ferruginibacter sp.]
MITSLAVPEPENGSLPGFATIFIHPNGEKSLISDIRIPKDSILCGFGSRAILESPNYLTLQVELRKHILLFPEVLQYINHSCEPNVFFDTTAMQLIALKEILPGEELCFFYPSTEWDMDRSFLCNCRTGSCLGLIRGAQYLPIETLTRYRLTDFIKSQLKSVGVGQE